MSGTLEMLDAVIARLRQRIPRVPAEYFPEQPEKYRLNHPVGAILVGYGGSRYDRASDAQGVMVQGRDVAVTLTVIVRQLNGRDGAVALLDEVRRAVLGFRMPNATDGLRAIKDDFLGQVAGLWQYALDLAAPSLVVEDRDEEDGPLLRHVTRLGPFERTETEKQPDGRITEEDHPL
ncbi:Gp37 family protein [Acidovorax sp. GBBC 3332]|nr:MULTISPECIES: Gp37 family protein [unclassified Acidovorax]MDA8449835.1 Gp37 family protein [Acidovorax sp. GBBC 3297]MDA8459280.1 Gp37 family protein [Acidovorax sp. GBBC 3333]MDA8464317.1 Gp37 family protein [Acidovorax sp. GBBC 3332]MDA8469473.1 Gp37 family protein [Acidovorax sp. GBBC 3299]